MSMYDEAYAAVLNGTAKASAFWIILVDENERDGYALRPLKWEGVGQYQRVVFNDGRDGFVKLEIGKSLPCSKNSVAIARRNNDDEDGGA